MGADPEGGPGMTHLSTRVPGEVELGAVRRLDYGTEIVTTDGGFEVRNNRWSTPRRTYDISFPISTRDDVVYLAVLALYAEAEGNLHSFDFPEWVDETGETLVPVRFDGPLAISGVAAHLDQIVEMHLVEVRGEPDS